MRPTHGRYGIALLATAPLVIGVLVSCSGPGGSPTAGSSAGSPTPQASASSAAATASELPQLTKDFSSIQHGYAINYPPDWTVTAATKPWAIGSDGDTPDDPTADTFRSAGTAGFVVSSQALPTGMTEEKWFEAYLSGGSPVHPECFPARAQWGPITIAGQAAGVHGGLPSCFFTEAVAIVAGRAYVFTAYPNLDAPGGGIFDRALFDAFVATIVFHPEDAR